MKIFREKTYKKICQTAFSEGMEKAYKLNNKDKRAMLLPCISSLKELRKNTWDIERVDNMIYWLECYIDE